MKLHSVVDFSLHYYFVSLFWLLFSLASSSILASNASSPFDDSANNTVSIIFSEKSSLYRDSTFLGMYYYGSDCQSLKGNSSSSSSDPQKIVCVSSNALASLVRYTVSPISLDLHLDKIGYVHDALIIDERYNFLYWSLRRSPSSIPSFQVDKYYLDTFTPVMSASSSSTPLSCQIFFDLIPTGANAPIFINGDAPDTNSNGLNPPDHFLYVGVEYRDKMVRIQPQTMTIFDTFSLSTEATRQMNSATILPYSTEATWYDLDYDKNFTVAVTPIFSKVRKISDTLETQDFFMVTRPNNTFSPLFQFVRFKIKNVFTIATSTTPRRLSSSTIVCEYPDQNILTFTHDVINYTGMTPQISRLIAGVYPDPGTNLETVMYLSVTIPSLAANNMSVDYCLDKILYIDNENPSSSSSTTSSNFVRLGCLDVFQLLSPRIVSMNLDPTSKILIYTSSSNALVFINTSFALSSSSNKNEVQVQEIPKLGITDTIRSITLASQYNGVLIITNSFLRRGLFCWNGNSAQCVQERETNQQNQNKGNLNPSPTGDINVGTQSTISAPILVGAIVSVIAAFVLIVVIYQTLKARRKRIAEELERRKNNNSSLGSEGGLDSIWNGVATNNISNANGNNNQQQQQPTVMIQMPASIVASSPIEGTINNDSDLSNYLLQNGERASQ